MKSLLALLLIVIEINAAAQNFYDSSVKISEILSLIMSSYTDTVNSQKMVDYAIQKLLDQTDPHTMYRNKQDTYNDFKMMRTGQKGIGIKYRLFYDTLTVVEVEKGSPADKCHIKPGMQIATINKQTVSNRLMSCADVKRILNYNFADDSIHLEIFQKRGTKIISIARDTIPIPSIESHYAPNDSTIYIRISRFNKKTAQEFNNIIAEYKPKKRNNVIIDVRENFGGTLSASIEICNQFLKNNMPIISTRSMREEDSTYFADGRGKLKNSRIYVLINEKSASASEILASCIQDCDRGIVIGRRSYGKGLIQRIIRLSDGSSIRLSTSKIISPSGRCLQKPFVRGEFEQYFNEIDNRKLTLENLYRDSIKTNNSPIFYTILKHRTVYGNSGVIPDCFISEDTTTKADFWNSWINCGTIENFAYDYINTNREKINHQYSQFSNFYNKFEIDNQMLQDLYSYTTTDTSQCIRISAAKFFKTANSSFGKTLKTELKAIFARIIFGNNEYRKILNYSDSDYLQAIKLIDNPTEYYKILN